MFIIIDTCDMSMCLVNLYSMYNRHKQDTTRPLENIETNNV